MLLVDSQVAVWLVLGEPRLGRRAREAIESAAAVHVSAVTVLELTIKSMIGRLRVPANLRDAFERQNLVFLDVKPEHAEAISRFPELVRHDPFDRVLVAQAEQEGLQLLTSDRVLLRLERDYIVDASK